MCSLKQNTFDLLNTFLFILLRVRTFIPIDSLSMALPTRMHSPRLRQSTLGPWLNDVGSGRPSAGDGQDEDEDESLYLTPPPERAATSGLTTMSNQRTLSIFDPNQPDEECVEEMQSAPSFFDPMESPLEILQDIQDLTFPILFEEEANVQVLDIDSVQDALDQDETTAIVSQADYSRILRLSEPLETIRLPSISASQQNGRTPAEMGTQELIALAEDFDESMARIQRLQDEIRDVRAMYRHLMMEEVESNHQRDDEEYVEDEDLINRGFYFERQDTTSDAELLRHFQTHLFHSGSEINEEMLDLENRDPEDALYAEYLDNYAEAVEAIERDYDVHRVTGFGIEDGLEIDDEDDNDDGLDWQDFSMDTTVPRDSQNRARPSSSPFRRRLSLLMESHDAGDETVDDIGLDLEEDDIALPQNDNAAASWSGFRSHGGALRASRHPTRAQSAPDSPIRQGGAHHTPAFYLDSNGDPRVDYGSPTNSPLSPPSRFLHPSRHHLIPPHSFFDDGEDDFVSRQQEEQDLEDMLGFRTPPFCRIDPNGDLECVVGPTRRSTRSTRSRGHRSRGNRESGHGTFSSEPSSQTTDSSSLSDPFENDDDVEVLILGASESNSEAGDLAKVGNVMRFRQVRQDWRDGAGECVGR